MTNIKRELTITLLFVYAIVYIFAPIRGLMSNGVTEIEAQDIIVVPTPEPVIEHTPRSYIKEVFGEDADKALLLLNGDENCGGENKQLDPKVFYTNTDGKRDRGMFQISERWHPSVSDECAFDFKCNTDYAYRMFVNDNRTFVRWTAGRCMGI